MARKDDKKKAEKAAPPTPGLAFVVGLILFGMILCPAGLFLFHNLKVFNILGIMVFHSLVLGCFTGLIIAVIPAFIFMHLTMKRLR